MNRELFEPGTKIICINDKQINACLVGDLKKGEIYTVKRDWGLGIYLNEIRSPNGSSYCSSRFIEYKEPEFDYQYNF